MAGKARHFPIPNTNIVLRMSRIRLVPLPLAASLLVLTFLCVLVKPLLATPGENPELLPIQKAAPAAVVIETAGSEGELRRQMREKNGVTGLRTGTIRFSEAPTGSFGFISPQSLGMVLVTQSPDLVLERVASTANAYEIHKVVGGSGLLVGFMDREAASQISSGERSKNLRIALYSNSVDKAPIIVAVPLIKLMADRMPIRLDLKKSDGPVILDMDLQGTVGRKSSVGR
ncbi:MAG: hypothetical protein KF693_10380 [Nitrospira sp.]|nr:hypothetical protein [Nitrospira sp.]